MPIPLPPKVIGPITTASSAIQVSGVLFLAQVEVFANGSQIGSGTANANGTTWVSVSPGTFSAGDTISATQTNSDGASAASPFPVPVLNVPNPLPIPVFVSPLSSCMSSLKIDGLVPGAEVVIRRAGAVVGKSTAADTSVWVPIIPTASLSGGDRLQAVQTIGGVASPAVLSVPINSAGRETVLSAPGIGQPLHACETSLSAFGVEPSADLIVENEGQTFSWFNVAPAYGAWGAPPFNEGKLVAHQAYPRCGVVGPNTTIPVGPAVPPGTPVIQAGICPDLNRITVSNLAPGAELWIYARESSAALPGSYTDTVIGSAGITHSVETFDLPPGIEPTTPSGNTVSLVALQIRCKLGSAGSVPATFAVAGGPFPPPILGSGVYACARTVIVQNAHIGAFVQPFSNSTGLPLADPVLALDSILVIKLWFPLASPDKIHLHQSGCNANGDSNTEVVNTIPSPVTVPKIGKPVRPAAPLVYLENVKGSRVHLLVNNVIRTSVDTIYSDVWVPTGAPPLKEGDRLFAVQTICAAESSFEGDVVTVTRGHMKLTISPPSIERGQTKPVTITAVDADTGTPISGAQVTLSGSAVGTTGAAFSVATSAGQPNLSGVVKSPVQYFDEPFTITLTDPPPKPQGKLTLNVGPIAPIPGKLVLTGATWTVTTQYGTSQTFTANGANATVTLPNPPGASGNVTVQLVTSWTASGEISGAYFPPTNFNGLMSPSPTTIVWSGSDLTAGWWALPNVAVDGAGNAVVYVVATFQGVA